MPDTDFNMKKNNLKKTIRIKVYSMSADQTNEPGFYKLSWLDITKCDLTWCCQQLKVCIRIC